MRRQPDHFECPEGDRLPRRLRRTRWAAKALAVAAAASCSVPSVGGALAYAAAPPRPASTGGLRAGTEAASTTPLQGKSYSLVTGGADLVGYGGAVAGEVGAQPSPAVGVAPTPDGHGAWVAEADGAVVALGDAAFKGSLLGVRLNQPVVGIAATPDGGGYWLVAADGGVFTFGDARYYGSTGGLRLNEPVVGMAATPDGGGYWLVASDGGIFTLGDARYYGSTGGLRLNEPVVGMAATPDGGGYWLVASDGGIFTLGDARYYGSTGGLRLNKPVVGMAATPDGGGYWLVAADGGIFTFGDAPYYGSGVASGQTVVGMAIEAGGYRNPLRAISGLVPERVDQGVDYAGGGPIYAIGDGVVINTLNSGWPGGAFISYRLLDGPAQGDVVFVAENVKPLVAVGQVVNSSTVLGDLINQYPNLETGWADPPGYGDTLAYAAGQWSSYDDSHSIPTAYGENFSQLLAALGAPSGVNYGPVSGTVPETWPRW
jgi:hypothetical protein